MLIHFMNESRDANESYSSGNRVLILSITREDIPNKKDYIELDGRGFKVVRRVFFPLIDAVEIWVEENAK